VLSGIASRSQAGRARCVPAAHLQLGGAGTHVAAALDSIGGLLGVQGSGDPAWLCGLLEWLRARGEKSTGGFFGFTRCSPHQPADFALLA
jgi:hypothetical protein